MYINNENSLFQALDQSRRAKKAGEQRNSDRAKNGGKSEGESPSQVERTLTYPSYTGRVNLSYISLQTRGTEPFTADRNHLQEKQKVGSARGVARQAVYGKRQTANVNLYHVTKLSIHLSFTVCSYTKKISFTLLYSIRIVLDCFH